jgi:hypothetical protein
VRGARDLPGFAEVKQIGADLLLAQPIRGDAVEFGELGDGADVGLGGALGVPAKLQVLDHPSA